MAFSTPHIPPRVLIVEDDVFIAMSIELMVQELGYEVVGPVGTVEAAMELIQSETIDAALLDVNLGRGLTTEPVAGRLRSDGVPYAFVTAYSRGAVSYAEDTDPVLSKPPTTFKLKTTLSDLTGSA